MQQIHLRQFRRDIHHGADGRIVFPGKTEITDGIITSGGNLTYADNGVDVQTQIDNVVASVAAIHGHVQDSVCYVDSKRVDAYTEDGSESLPYKTLSTALTVRLANDKTDFVSFRVASGNYDGTISIDKDTANQSFEIVGAGRNSTFIRGAATFVNTTGSVLYFRDFLDVTIKDVTISNGLYGFYPRSCRNVKLFNCEFKNLGSDGEEKYHDQSESQANQAAFWASNSTSDGGTCRIRSCTDVRIDNCRTSYCLRGFRIQDCGGGALTNLRGYKTLESFIYLASGTYNGAGGCSNFYISGCVADSIFHAGFQVIGGKNNTIQGCTAINCASSPFISWHSTDLRIIGCTVDKCCTKTWIGIGALGDSYGQVYMSGIANVEDTGGYLLTCLNNTFTQCGVGRALSGNSTMFYFLLNANASNSRFIIDGNHTDAVVPLYNPDSITELLCQYPVSGGPSQSEFDALESDVGDNTTELTNRLKLDTAQTLSSGWLTIQRANDDATLWVTRSGYTTLKLEARNGYGRIRYSGAKFDMWSSGRYKMEGSHLQLPMNASAPTDNAANSKGGLWVDTSVTPHVLKFHNGTAWKTVTIS